MAKVSETVNTNLPEDVAIQLAIERRLLSFDEATQRQRQREKERPILTSEDAAWNREELYDDRGLPG